MSQYDVIFSFYRLTASSCSESEELEAGEAGPKFSLPDKVDARLLALLTRTVIVLTLVSVYKLYTVYNDLT